MIAATATRLAKFQLQKGIFPESYIAPPEIQPDSSERTRYRAGPLVNPQRHEEPNPGSSLAPFRDLHSFSDLFGKQGRRFLEALELPPASQAVLTSSLSCWPLLEVVRHVQDVEKWMEKNIEEDEIVRLLTGNSRDWVDSGVMWSARKSAK